MICIYIALIAPNMSSRMSSCDTCFCKKQTLLVILLCYKKEEVKVILRSIVNVTVIDASVYITSSLYVCAYVNSRKIVIRHTFSPNVPDYNQTPCSSDEIIVKFYTNHIIL